MKKFKRDKTEMKRIMAAAIAILIVIAMVLSMAIPFVYGAEINQPKIEITGEVGIGKKYKLTSPTPFVMKMTNTGADFKGELQYLLDVSQNQYTKSYQIYAYPIELPQGSSKTFEMEIPIGVVKSSFKVNVVDANEKIVASKTIYTSALEPGTVLGGILVDEKNSIGYLRQFELNKLSTSQQKTVADRLVVLDESTFPTTESILQNFNFLIINDFDTSKLSKVQIEALTQWVENGGILILGTGPNFDKVMKGIPTNLLDITFRANKTLQDLPELSARTGLTIEDPLAYCELEIPGAEPRFTDSGHTLTSALPKGEGHILVHHFDLGIEPIPLLNRGRLSAEFLEKIYLPYVTANTQRETAVITDRYYYGYDQTSNLPHFKSGYLTVMYGIIILYGLLIGPVLYLVLKRRDKREHAIVWIPILAVATIFVLFFVSLNSIYRKPIVNTLSYSVLPSDGGAAKRQSRIGAMTSDSGDITVDFAGNQDIYFPKDNYGYSYYASGSPVREEKLAKIVYGENKKMVFFDKSSWNDLRFTRSDTILFGEGLSCSIELVGDMLVGTIANHTGRDLVDVIVGFRNTGYKRYDSLPNGGTVDIELKIVTDSSMYNNGIYNAFPDVYSNNGKDYTNEEKRQIIMKRDMLNYHMSEQSNNYSTRGYVSSSFPIAVANTMQTRQFDSADQSLNVEVYAFNYDPLDELGVMINGRKATEFNLNLLETKVPINFATMKDIDLPYGLLGVTELATEASYDTDGTRVSLYSTGSVQFTFSVPESIRANLFQIEWDDKGIYSRMDSYGKALGVEQQIYNVKTDTWESLSKSEYRQTMPAYIQYEDGVGKISVRVENLPSETEVVFPRIRVKGGH